jgi:hypothetical protein
VKDPTKTTRCTSKRPRARRAVQSPVRPSEPARAPHTGSLSAPVRPNCDKLPVTNQLPAAHKNASQRPKALGGILLHSAPPGTRTPNLLIKSQLL